MNSMRHGAAIASPSRWDTEWFRAHSATPAIRRLPALWGSVTSSQYPIVIALRFVEHTFRAPIAVTGRRCRLGCVFVEGREFATLPISYCTVLATPSVFRRIGNGVRYYTLTEAGRGLILGYGILPQAPPLPVASPPHDTPGLLQIGSPVCCHVNAVAIPMFPQRFEHLRVRPRRRFCQGAGVLAHRLARHCE